MSAARRALALALLAACASQGAPEGIGEAPGREHAPRARGAPQEVDSAGPLMEAAGASGDAPAAAEAARLERALAAVRAGDLSADVAFLASDELEGRGTPGVGQRIAARYLRARMERLGWSPGTPDGWFHRFQLHARRVDPRGTRATWRRGGSALPLAYGLDFGLHPSEPTGGSWSGGLVFAGGGATADLAGLELAGRWAVCADTGAARDHDAARASGAVGFLVLPREGRPPPFGDWHQRLLRTHARWPLPKDLEALPTLRAGADLAGALLEASGHGGLPPVGGLLAGELHATVRGAGLVELENVCALWPGEGPRAGELLVLTAHYDHVGVSPRTGEIFNGADDNASGVAGLLAVAEALTHLGPLERGVLLLWVSAEELGLLGARAWAEAPPLPEGLRAVANLNLDMIGRNGPDEILLTPSRHHPGRNPVAEALEAALRAEGFARIGDGDQFWERSDHAVFAERLGLPVAFATNGEHEDYHRPSDTAEKLDAQKAARVARAAVRALVELQRAPLAAGERPALTR